MTETLREEGHRIPLESLTRAPKEVLSTPTSAISPGNTSQSPEKVLVADPATAEGQEIGAVLAIKQYCWIPPDFGD